MLGEKTKRRPRCCFEEREEVRSDLALTQPDPLTRPSVFTWGNKAALRNWPNGSRVVAPRREAGGRSRIFLPPCIFPGPVLRNTGAGRRPESKQAFDRSSQVAPSTNGPFSRRTSRSRLLTLHALLLSLCGLVGSLWCAATYRQQSQRGDERVSGREGPSASGGLEFSVLVTIAIKLGGYEVSGCNRGHDKYTG